MKARFLFFALLSTGLLIGCSKGGNPKAENSTETNTTKTPKNEFTINRTYTTDFGDLELKEDLKKVKGTYGYSGENGTNVKGSLNGNLSEMILTFDWEQVQGNQKSGGTGTFTFADNGKTFTGTWTDTKGGKGEWNGSAK